MDTDDDRLNEEEVEWWQRYFSSSLSDGSRVVHGHWGAIREDGQAVDERTKPASTRVEGDGTGEGRFREDIYDESKVAERQRRREYRRPTPTPTIHVDPELARAFKILELREDANAEQVKTSYRLLMKRHHPDVSSEPDANQKTRLISEAYSVLKARGRA